MLQDSLAAYDRLPAARKVLFAAPEDMGVAVLRTFAPKGWEVTPQIGDDLGRRLARAFKQLLASAGAAIVVGSDAPTGPVDAVAAALPRLAGERRALLGPAEDGGYWLLGLTTHEPGLFDGVPWGTPEVLSSTRLLLGVHGFAVEELPLAHDVDDERGLERLRAELRAHPDRAPRCARLLRG